MAPGAGALPADPGAARRAAAEFVSFALKLASSPELPEAGAFASLVAGASAVLGDEPDGLRPRDSRGEPGGLVRLPPHPVVLVPDLHARPGFLARVLGWRPGLGAGQAQGTEPEGEGPEGPSVAELLAAGEGSLVCLGDAFHSEAGTAAQRWRLAYGEYLGGWRRHEAMDEEMALTLSTVRIILAAKTAFPAVFHYIKGNHDNITNADERGDLGFYKFAAEGEMVASWFARAYGRSLLEAYRRLELDLPLVAVGERFAASHGEPAFTMGVEDIVEYRRRDDVVGGLIWTGNGEAEAGSVQGSLANLFGALSGRARWFGGHRPVQGRFALRAGGSYVQFHDPRSWQVALILPGRDPDPERDIRLLDSGSY